MKEWNERRLDDFFRLNFDSRTCKLAIKSEVMTVTDGQGESLKFIIKENRIYCPDLDKYYRG